MKKTFKALSDANRREILTLLRAGRLNAGEIAGHFDMAAATVSYHLNVLKEADLVLETREGNFRYYALNASVMEEVLAYFMGFLPQKEKDHCHEV